MRNAIEHAVRGFALDARGNITLAAALALVPLITAAGVAVDYSRVSGAKAQVQAALDSGVIAASTESNGRTEAELRATIEKFMVANPARTEIIGANLGVAASNEWTVKATYDGCVALNFGYVLGQSQQCFQLVSEAKRGKNHLEVALVLDNTGSMESNNRIGNLRTAATSLVDILKNAASNGRTLKISLVPFVTAVNVMGDSYTANWIDWNAQNPLHGTNFDPPTGTPAGTKVNHTALFTKMQIPWKGCVEARPGAYALNDTPPSVGDPSSLFVPYFAPDEPGGAAAGGNTPDKYNNSYLADGVSGTDSQKQRSIAKYDTAVPRPVPIVENAPNVTTGQNITNGPNRACPTPIVPLTDDFTKLKANINAMRYWNGSGTNVSEGLMWGWRVLSPDAPYTEGRSFTDPTVQKVIVLLTDGENVVYGSSGTANKSDYGAYGFLATGRFNATDQTTAARNVDGWVQQTCTNLKNRGVLIYTITLEAGTAANLALYGACASRADMYYNSPSASQLDGIFKNIAQQLVALRLTY
jgi:Flp pilus assembly protein TadG